MKKIHPKFIDSLPFSNINEINQKQTCHKVINITGCNNICSVLDYLIENFEVIPLNIFIFIFKFDAVKSWLFDRQKLEELNEKCKNFKFNRIFVFQMKFKTTKFLCQIKGNQKLTKIELNRGLNDHDFYNQLVTNELIFKSIVQSSIEIMICGFYDHSFSDIIVNVDRHFLGLKLVDYALINFDWLSFEFLQLFGIDLSLKNENGDRPLETAIKCGNFEGFKALLANDAGNLEFLELLHGPSGYSLMMLAAENGNVDILEYLLQLKLFDVNFSVNGVNALKIALNENKFEAVLMLLEYDAIYDDNFVEKVKKLYDHEGKKLKMRRKSSAESGICEKIRVLSVNCEDGKDCKNAGNEIQITQDIEEKETFAKIVGINKEKSDSKSDEDLQNEVKIRKHAEKIYYFLQDVQKLHQLLESRNEHEILKILERYPKICNFFNTKSQSVIKCALQSTSTNEKNLVIETDFDDKSSSIFIEFLLVNGLRVGKNEELNLKNHVNPIFCDYFHKILVKCTADESGQSKDEDFILNDQKYAQIQSFIENSSRISNQNFHLYDNEALDLEIPTKKLRIDNSDCESVKTCENFEVISNPDSEIYQETFELLIEDAMNDIDNALSVVPKESKKSLTLDSSNDLECGSNKSTFKIVQSDPRGANTDNSNSSEFLHQNTFQSALKEEEFSFHHHDSKQLKNKLLIDMLKILSKQPETKILLQIISAYDDVNFILDLNQKYLVNKIDCDELRERFLASCKITSKSIESVDNFEGNRENSGIKLDFSENSQNSNESFLKIPRQKRSFSECTSDNLSIFSYDSLCSTDSNKPKVSNCLQKRNQNYSDHHNSSFIYANFPNFKEQFSFMQNILDDERNRTSKNRKLPIYDMKSTLKMQKFIFVDSGTSKFQSFTKNNFPFNFKLNSDDSSSEFSYMTDTTLKSAVSSESSCVSFEFITEKVESRNSINFVDEESKDSEQFKNFSDNNSTSNNLTLNFIVNVLKLVLLRTFGNNFKPYKKNDRKSKKHFDKIVKKLRKKFAKKKINEKMLENLFKYEPKDNWHQALITCVPKLCTLYGNDEKSLL